MPSGNGTGYRKSFSRSIEAAVALSVSLTFVCLLGAKWIARALGDTCASVAGRILGVLLTALAVQIALDGLKQAFVPG